MLRSSRGSSDSEPEHEQAYFVRAQTEQQISCETVDMPHADVKSDFDLKFVPMTMNLIAYSYGHREQIEMEIAKSQQLHTGYKERAAAIIASGDCQVLQMG
jgi:hypothetical protein